MPKVMLPDWVREEDSLHPLLGGGLGPYATRLLSDPGGLTQFGAFLEELPRVPPLADGIGMKPRMKWS
ncbi:hypothetical protein ACFSHQ_20925 [Gemmobacter lanyuensis]